MEKIKSIINKLTKPNEKLPQVINKSRIFNTYVALIEVGVIAFWFIVPARTNQSSHVMNFALDSGLNIFACLYVHVNYRIAYFQKSILACLGSVVYIIYLMVKTFEMFVATQSSCLHVFAYFNKIQKEAQSKSLCYQMTFIYLVWLCVFCFVMVVRAM